MVSTGPVSAASRIIAAGLAAIIRPALLPGVAAPWVLILLGLMLAVPAAAALFARTWYARLLRAEQSPRPKT
jgi:hypothetical protein